jgi:hypothetical protein
VGFSDFNDDVASKIIFIGQCAHGTEWEGKQIESNYKNLGRIFYFYNALRKIGLYDKTKKKLLIFLTKNLTAFENKIILG